MQLGRTRRRRVVARLRRAFGRSGGRERNRKLLLHRSEIEKLAGRVALESLALVPLAVYFKEGRAKVELGLAKGRRRYDKREAIATRDADRDTERALAHRQTGKGRDPRDV
jgi:SsrA-binding protein